MDWAIRAVNVLHVIDKVPLVIVPQRSEWKIRGHEREQVAYVVVDAEANERIVDHVQHVFDFDVDGVVAARQNRRVFCVRELGQNYARVAIQLEGDVAQRDTIVVLVDDVEALLELDDHALGAILLVVQIGDVVGLDASWVVGDANVSWRKEKVNAHRCHQANQECEQNPEPSFQFKILLKL